MLDKTRQILESHGIGWTDIAAILMDYKSLMDPTNKCIEGYGYTWLEALRFDHIRKAAEHLRYVVWFRKAMNLYEKNLRRRQEAGRKGWQTRRKRGKS